MKKKIATGVIIIALSALGIMSFLTFQKIQNNRLIAERTSTLIPLKLSDIKGNAITIGDGDTERPVIIIHFKTWCPFCQSEIQDILKNEDLLGRAEIFLISNESVNKLNGFSKEYELSLRPDIRILHDMVGKVTEHFGVKSVPSTFIYKNGYLLQRFDGVVKSETMVNLIIESE